MKEIHTEHRGKKTTTTTTAQACESFETNAFQPEIHECESEQLKRRLTDQNIKEEKTLCHDSQT